MNFLLNEEQRQLSDSAREFLNAQSPLSLQRMRCAVDAIQASQEIIAQWIEGNTRAFSAAAELDDE